MSITIKKVFNMKEKFELGALRSLSQLITGEPVQDKHSALTKEDIKAAMTIKPKLFSDEKCNVKSVKPIFLEIINTEQSRLKLFEGIETDLNFIIQDVQINATQKRFIQEFLAKFKPIIASQRALCAHINKAHEKWPLDEAETVNSNAIQLFLEIYASDESFDVHTKALQDFIGHIDKWFKMDALLRDEIRPLCIPVEKVPTIAGPCLYTFSVQMVQSLTRRVMPVEELLKALDLAACDRIEDIKKSHGIMAYFPTQFNLLNALKEDGYVRPKTLKPLQDTFFNKNSERQLIYFLTNAKTLPEQLSSFEKFIAGSNAGLRLQFFKDIVALLDKKPWCVSDLQLLAPYFSGDNPLKLHPDVLEAIQTALYEDSDAVVKINPIVSALVPAIEMVCKDLTLMLQAFQAEPNLSESLSGVDFAPVARVLQIEEDREERNQVAKVFFERELKKQIDGLKAANIFHDACFEGIEDKICARFLEPLLNSDNDELLFLSQYAAALLNMPSFLMAILPENFGEDRVKKGTILSYSFCPELNSGATALNLDSLKKCLLEKQKGYEAQNHDFLEKSKNNTSVFELFNLVKAHSSADYREIKEEIRALNNTTVEKVDKKKPSFLSETPQHTRIQKGGDRPIENLADNMNTPSRTAIPFSVKLPAMLPNTPLNSRSDDDEIKTPPTPPGTPCTPRNGRFSPSAIFTPTRAVFNGFIAYIKQKLDSWFIQGYTKSTMKPCEDPSKYDFVTAYDKGIHVFTAEKEAERWRVTAYSQEDAHVKAIVSGMAQSKKDQADSKPILYIAIVASDKKVPELIEKNVAAALDEGFLPGITVNSKVLTEKELQEELKPNAKLLKRYNEAIKPAASLSRQPDAMFSRCSGGCPATSRPVPSARRVLAF